MIWYENAEEDLAGYKVHYGTSSGNYESTIDVGNITEYKLAGLREGMNYLVVTAYDTFDNDSDFSIELEYFAGDGIPDDEDNCPLTPNGPDMGTCAQTTISGVVIGNGVICTDDDDCKADETCQMNQEDYNGNDIGDVCECYADFDGDGYVYPSDLIIFNLEFGRDDCFTNFPPCQADIDEDGLVYFTDLMIINSEYGRDNCPVLH